MRRQPGTLGEQLQSVRATAGLSQTELGDLCGIPKPALSRYENDHVVPSIITLRKLAGALNTHVAMLLPACDRDGYLGEALARRGLRARNASEAERIADSIDNALRAAR